MCCLCECWRVKSRDGEYVQLYSVSGFSGFLSFHCVWKNVVFWKKVYIKKKFINTFWKIEKNVSEKTLAMSTWLRIDTWSWSPIAIYEGDVRNCRCQKGFQANALHVSFCINVLILCELQQVDYFWLLFKHEYLYFYLSEGCVYSCPLGSQEGVWCAEGVRHQWETRHSRALWKVNLLCVCVCVGGFAKGSYLILSGSSLQRERALEAPVSAS